MAETLFSWKKSFFSTAPYFSVSKYVKNMNFEKFSFLILTPKQKNI